jgi:hypothetical protein
MERGGIVQVETATPIMGQSNGLGSACKAASGLLASAFAEPCMKPQTSSPHDRAVGNGNTPTINNIF